MKSILFLKVLQSSLMPTRYFFGAGIQHIQTSNRLFQNIWPPRREQLNRNELSASCRKFSVLKDQVCPRHMQCSKFFCILILMNKFQKLITCLQAIIFSQNQDKYC
ncbi:hypothetical protein GPALN_016307 [Globodera pallida]|nr:hypothetical protein GPALN_016307 [Globodera pallida]